MDDKRPSTDAPPAAPATSERVTLSIEQCEQSYIAGYRQASHDILLTLLAAFIAVQIVNLLLNRE